MRGGSVDGGSLASCCVNFDIGPIVARRSTRRRVMRKGRFRFEAGEEVIIEAGNYD